VRIRGDAGALMFDALMFEALVFEALGLGGTALTRIDSRLSVLPW
jgi:hypothetical protein